MLVAVASGINLSALFANVGSITTIIAIVGALVARSVKHTIRNEITAVVNDVISREVTPKFTEIRQGLADLRTRSNDHAVSIGRLEGIQEGKTAAAREANLTTKGNP
jgi:hypothetical protein